MSEQYPAPVGDERAAEVAEHDVAALDPALGGIVVGLAALAPAATMAKLTRSVALVEESPADVGGHLGLGATDEQDVAALQLSCDPVGGGAGPAEGIDLGIVLDGAERRGDDAGLAERRLGQR